MFNRFVIYGVVAGALSGAILTSYLISPKKEVVYLTKTINIQANTNTKVKTTVKEIIKKASGDIITREVKEDLEQSSNTTTSLDTKIETSTGIDTRRFSLGVGINAKYRSEVMLSLGYYLTPNLNLNISSELNVKKFSIDSSSFWIGVRIDF